MWLWVQSPQATLFAWWVYQSGNPSRMAGLPKWQSFPHGKS